ncbi:unnamed protein product [Urochloa decumbens]|uniref:Uncharacterized protein n=1 Tax=Urochloa decumbens TaxID=240449 RepID=A0ABC9BZN0_9POAL
MSTVGLVDWRGKPINTKVHGGVRAALFLYFLVVVNYMVQSPNLQNLVTYLRGVMHMGVSDASTTVTNFIGAMCGFALLGAFLSDSYITCSRTMLLSTLLVILGFGLLSLQAHLPSLHPPHCDPASDPGNCEQVSGWSSTLLYAALYITALGEGFMRACIPALGADQFDGDDPSESRQQSSFFNWFAFWLSTGVISGLIFIVWLQTSKGWDIGFGLSALITLLGLLVASAGLPLYRNRVPQGSALTRILQVFVVAFKNRNLDRPEKMEEARENREEMNSEELPRPTNCIDSIEFLDKACINTGRDGAWSVCDAAKVEETKVVLHMLPLVFSATVAHVSSPLLVAFTVQQGGTTNTRLGKLHVYPAMLAIIPSAFQLLMLVAYDRLLVPFLRRRTGYEGGITHLQRVGIGFASNIVAPVVAAIVERKRKEMVAAGVEMSLFWLAPQFFLLGMQETTAFVGLLEFFNSEAPGSMKSIGVALFWCQIGMASFLGTLLVRVVNKVTRHGGGHGWLEGGNLNATRLDLFYWAVAAVALLGWLNFLYWAKRYKYRLDPRLAAKPGDKDSSP